MKLLSTIIGISFYGLETSLRNYVCSWANPLEFYFSTLKKLSFNSIRLPFSQDYILANNFEVMDEFFDLAVKYDFNITLDFHRVNEDYQSYSPISNIPLEEFLKTWYIVIDRYQHNPKLFGISVFNEYQGADDAWYNSLLKTILLAIDSQFPNNSFLYLAGCSNWSGNCRKTDVEDLPFSDRVHYAWHKYFFSSDPANYTTEWERSVGKYPQKIILEEWGFQYIPEEIEWAEEFIVWLKEKNITNNFYWTIAHSMGTDGLFMDNDCTTINWEKYNIVKKLWD